MAVAWQVRAREKEWPEKDIASIEAMMKVGRDTSTVIRVTFWEITIRSTPLVLDTPLEKPKLWSWKKDVSPEPTFAKSNDAINWCPAHGFVCEPTANGCGMAKIVQFDFCQCPPRGHFFDCEVYLWQQEAKKKKQEPLQEVVVPPRKRKKQDVPTATQLRFEIK